MKNQRETLTTVYTITRRGAMASGAVALAGLTMHATTGWAATEDGISSSEIIRQEPVFQASRKRVYEALTDAKQFEHIVRLSEASRSMSIGSQPAEISSEVGGSFALFGGHITGRHLDLAPNERIVQAWRAAGWDPGDHSIVKFLLVEQGSATKIVFEHKGFPAGQAQHLAAGWKGNYWEPLEKFLAQK